MNFFTHDEPKPDPEIEARWRKRLAPYYAEAGIDPSALPTAPVRAPFDAALCAVIEETRPAVLSFHFGLPNAELLSRVKAAGALILCSTTTVTEARSLEQHGVDAVIAQGREAGGHRGMFLSDDIDAQPGLISLMPQVRDAVRLPSWRPAESAMGAESRPPLRSAPMRSRSALLICARRRRRFARCIALRLQARGTMQRA